MQQLIDNKTQTRPYQMKNNLKCAIIMNRMRLAKQCAKMGLIRAKSYKRTILESSKRKKTYNLQFNFIVYL